MPKRTLVDRPSSGRSRSSPIALATAADREKPNITGSPALRLPHLNEKQLAERWGVSVRTLQAARVKGSGAPYLRIGGAVRYRLEDVLAYEQAHLRTHTSETH